MKLVDILLEDVNDLNEIVKKTLIFSVSDNEHCAVQLIPSILNTVERDKLYLDIHLDLFLETETIRPEVFHETIMGIIEILMRRGIQEKTWKNQPIMNVLLLRYKEITLHKDKLNVNLFKYINPQLRDEIRRATYINGLIAGQEDYFFIKDTFLPTIDADYSTDQVIHTNRAKNIYRAFRKGKINGVPYYLDDYQKLAVVPDYSKVDFDKNIIKPHFNINILTSEPHVPEGHDVYDAIVGLRDKFSKLGITLLIY